MSKIIFCWISLMLSVHCVFGQVSSTATASTSAILLTPVGTENSTNILEANFYPELNNDIIGIIKKDYTQGTFVNSRLPSFEIVGNEFSYAITLSYDPVLRNQNSGQTNIKVESLSVIWEMETRLKEPASNRFVIDAKLNSNNLLSAGTYSAANPVAVTIYFN